jgi:hypothetical protein
MRVHWLSPRLPILPLTALLLWAWQTPPLGAQQPEGADRRACVFLIVDLSDSEEHNQYQQIITGQLEMELQSTGYAVVPAQQWQDEAQRLGVGPRDLVAGSQAIRVAKGVSAQLAVNGFYRVEAGRIVLELKAYDAEQEAFITGVMRTGALNLSMYNLIDSAVAQMLPQIHLIGEPGPPEEIPQVKAVTLFSRDEDMEVYLPGDRFVGRIRQGALTLPDMALPLGSELILVKRKVGYHPSSETFKLAQPRPELQLRRLSKQTRWATELSWTTKQLMGFGIAQRYYLDPDALFLALQHYFYVQHTLEEAARPVFHNDLCLLVGGYPFSGAEAALRIGFSTGLGVILTYLSEPGQPLFTDFYWNFINTWLEWSLPHLSLYFMSGGRYALGLGTNILGAGGGSDGPQLSLGVMYRW